MGGTSALCLLLAAIVALMLGGVILSLAASPPVATRIGLGEAIFEAMPDVTMLYCSTAAVALCLPARRQRNFPARASDYRRQMTEYFEHEPMLGSIPSVIAR